MFCSECGQENVDDAKFCVKCGKKFALEESPSMPAPEIEQPSKPVSQESTPARSLSSGGTAVQASTELKDSGTVTVMSVIGLVFGLIGMLGSFIPCLGSLAFYIGIPAAIISAIGLFIAYSQNAKRTFAIVALTISLIGVVFSGWQYFSIISAGKNAERKLNEMFNQGQQQNAPAPKYAPPVETPAPEPPASGTQTKIMKGIVTNVAFGSHAGNITVKNENQEIEFFGNDSMKVSGGFPSKGDEVTIYYHETSSSDTPYIINTLIKSNVSKANKNMQLEKTTRFKALNDGTVLDTQTNLMWAAEDNNSDISWADAKIYCKNYRGGGYKDWRMPTQKELAGLYESAKSKDNFQGGCDKGGYLMNLIHLTRCSPWASEKRDYEAAVVNLANGGQFYVEKKNEYEWNKGRVLPVRNAR